MNSNPHNAMSSAAACRLRRRDTAADRRFARACWDLKSACTRRFAQLRANRKTRGVCWRGRRGSVREGSRSRATGCGHGRGGSDCVCGGGRRLGRLQPRAARTSRQNPRDAAAHAEFGRVRGRGSDSHSSDDSGAEGEAATHEEGLQRRRRRRQRPASASESGCATAGYAVGCCEFFVTIAPDHHTQKRQHHRAPEGRPEAAYVKSAHNRRTRPGSSRR
jgi:hypothetical protein